MYTPEDHAILERALERTGLEVFYMIAGDVRDYEIMDECEYRRGLEAQYHNYCISEEEFYVS